MFVQIRLVLGRVDVSTIAYLLLGLSHSSFYIVHRKIATAGHNGPNGDKSHIKLLLEAHVQCGQQVKLKIGTESDTL